MQNPINPVNPVQKQITGAILAGGMSRRMGQPKEGVLMPDGRPMLAHVIAALQAVCTRVAVVGECRGCRLPTEVIHLADRHPGLGPLAGIEAVLESGLDELYLVAACDQPLLTPAVLRRLIDHPAVGIRVFVGGKGKFSPFPGIYPASWLPAVQAAIHRNELAVCRLIDRSPYTMIELPENERERVRSFNSPDDLKTMSRLS